MGEGRSGNDECLESDLGEDDETLVSLQKRAAQSLSKAAS